MPYEAISDSDQIIAAGRALRNALGQRLAVESTRLIGFPSNHIRDANVRFDSNGGKSALWWHKFPSEDGTVNINLFGIDDPNARKHLGSESNSFPNKLTQLVYICTVHLLGTGLEQKANSQDDCIRFHYHFQ